MCIVHDLVLDRKQKFPAYVCDPLFLCLARGNSFPVKRRRDSEIAPCDFSSASCNPFHSHRSSPHPAFPAPPAPSSLSLSLPRSVFEAFAFLGEFRSFALKIDGARERISREIFEVRFESSRMANAFDGAEYREDMCYRGLWILFLED